jgi:hypothetical protein
MAPVSSVATPGPFGYGIPARQPSRVSAFLTPLRGQHFECAGSERTANDVGGHAFRLAQPARNFSFEQS